MPVKKNTVAKRNKKSEVVDMSIFEGETGLENVTSNDCKLPILSILQDLSPQVKKNKPEYIEGAEIGNICNATIGDVFEEVHFLPCAYKMNILEWLPNRGGLVQMHGSDRSILSKCEPNPETGKPTLPNGNIVMEHAEWYILNLTANGRQEFMSLTWSQMNPSKKLMTAIRSERIQLESGDNIQAPLWFRTYKATAAERVSAKGDASLVWVFKPDVPVLQHDPSGSLVTSARDFNKLVHEGQVKTQADDPSNIDDDTM
jgi:hypothetical protein